MKSKRDLTAGDVLKKEGLFAEEEVAKYFFGDE